VDVPAIPRENAESIPGFTRLYGQGAIYSISFVDEHTARHTASMLRAQPLDTWSVEEVIKAMAPGKVQRLIGQVPEPDFREPFNEDEYPE
jgi:hypothetical protein